jgi:hypothetical protein
MELELARPGRRDKALAAIKKWEALKQDKSDALKYENDRLAWLMTLKDSGETIENSEISQARDDSRDALFVAKSRRILFNLISVQWQSPAELWLKNKNDSAKTKIEEYNRMKEPVIGRWIKKFPNPAASEFASGPQKADACAEVKGAVLSWLTARAHVEAAKTFCETFRYTIVKTLHSETEAYCFGAPRKFDDKRDEPINQATERSVDLYRGEVEQMASWLKAASCPMPQRLELPKA